MSYLKVVKIVAGFALIWVLFAKPTASIVTDKSTIYKIDTAKSYIHWECAHFGYIKFKSGNFLLDENNLMKKAYVTVDMKSVINTDIDNKLLQGTLQNVLRSIEFFNTSVFPESHFELDYVEKLEGDNYKVQGDFIIFNKGICKDYEAQIKTTGDSLYFNTKTISLDRTDWGIYYGSRNNPQPKDEEDGFVVTDTILIDVHIKAYKQLN
jgi:polyisoprenoid-binding protein YceI